VHAAPLRLLPNFSLKDATTPPAALRGAKMRDDRVIHFNSGSEKPWVHALRFECLQCGELRERSAGVNGRRPESADAAATSAGPFLRNYQS
jgi:hypothetical protein